MTENKKIQIEFAPGCFDNFEGSQEELDQLIAEITRLAESGELQERSVSIDLSLLSEKDLASLSEALDGQIPERKLQ